MKKNSARPNIAAGTLFLLLTVCFAGNATAVSVVADTAVTRTINVESDWRIPPPEDLRFPLVYYLVDNGMGLSLTLRYDGAVTEEALGADYPPVEKVTQREPKRDAPEEEFRAEDFFHHSCLSSWRIPGKRERGLVLPTYLGCIILDEHRENRVYYTMTFAPATTAGSYVRLFLDGYARPHPGTNIPNAERTAKAPHDSWAGNMFILDALKKNGTLAAIYRTSGRPADLGFRPEFAKTTFVLLDTFRSVTFTPPHGKFDARITNPLPGMTLEYLAEPEAK